MPIGKFSPSIMTVMRVVGIHSLLEVLEVEFGE
jgi:hypothetical protein